MALNFSTILAIITLAASAPNQLSAQSEVLVEAQQQGDISFVTGGIGEDETLALKAMQAHYNLHVLNADKAGHFSGNTRIVISNMKHVPLLDTTSGPIFYAALPKGRYIVEGYNKEQSKKQVVTITNKNPARIRFFWPADISNTDNK